MMDATSRIYNFPVYDSYISRGLHRPETHRELARGRYREERAAIF